MQPETAFAAMAAAAAAEAVAMRCTNAVSPVISARFAASAPSFSGSRPSRHPISARLEVMHHSRSRPQLPTLHRQLMDEGLLSHTKDYTSLITALGKGVAWQDANALLGLMRQRALRPNVVTFSALMSVSASASQARHLQLQCCNGCLCERDRRLWPRLAVA